MTVAVLLRVLVDALVSEKCAVLFERAGCRAASATLGSAMTAPSESDNGHAVWLAASSPIRV